jgi:hypothetical protein
MIGFAASSVNPLSIVNEVASFWTALHWKNIPVEEAFIETFGGRREMLSHCPMVLITRSDKNVSQFNVAVQEYYELMFLFSIRRSNVPCLHMVP